MVSKTVNASFPSNQERIVASALLILSCSSPREKGKPCCIPESFQDPRISVSESVSGFASSEISCSGEYSCDQHLKVLEFVPPLHELQLKIVRKKRSKSIYTSKGQKMKSITSEHVSSICVSEITSADVSSSLSSTLSSLNIALDNQRRPLTSSHMQCTLEAILRVLSGGNTSEAKIRQLLGDSPSTSKALRMLLKLEKVKRCGAGGRNDPYIYKIAQ